MKVVSREEWTRARTALLVREKEFSREREALAQARRDLPWEEVTKDYVFDGPDGKLTLPGLFGDCGQLVVYHFMFPPEWDAGCPHCSRSGRSSPSSRPRSRRPWRDWSGPAR